MVRARKPDTIIALVEAIPLDTPVADVIEKLKALGHTLKPPQVHRVRWQIRKYQASGRALVVPATGGASSPAPLVVTPKVKRDLPPKNDPVETAFRKCLMDLGLVRARRLMADFERIYDGLEFMGAK